METAIRFSGYLGSVVLLFGVLGALITGSFTAHLLVSLHLVLGLLLLIGWAVTSGTQGMSKAGAVITGRAGRFGANVAAYTTVVVGLLVVANVFATINDKRWDLTEAGVYSLSEKSVQVIRSLKAPLEIVLVDAPQLQNKERVEELVKLYRYHNPGMVKAEVVDPRARPIEVERRGLKPGNLVYLEYGEGDRKAVSRINETDEGAITNAIIKLTRGAAKKVYYVEGHGEPELSSGGQDGAKEFADLLQDEHVTVESLLLPQVGKIPEDAAGVIIAAPQRDFSQPERDAVTSYVSGGGRLILLDNPEQRASSEIASLAAGFGIEVGKDIVIDQQLRLFAGPELAVQFYAQQYGQHLITSKLSRSSPPIFTFSSSVTVKDRSVGGVYTELLKTGPNSWAEKGIGQIFDSPEPSASLDANDVRGPISIAVAFDKKVTPASGEEGKDGSFDRASRVVVFGDATWMTNGNLGAIGNRELLLNTVNWVLGEEGGIAIGPRQLRASDLSTMTEANFRLILALGFVGPELILLFGLFIWWRRRTAFV